MRLAVFDDNAVGVVDGPWLWDITAVLPERWRQTPYAMNETIRTFDALRPAIEQHVAKTQPRDLTSVALRPPVPAPAHVFAAPLNYPVHVEEMAGSVHVARDWRASSAQQLGFFLKAPGSIVGPGDAIELPDLPDREFHHEAELAVVVGRDARAVPAKRALDHIFGYTCLLDITLRNTRDEQQERVMRKSYETFTPLGPFLVTADEVADPTNLDLRLWVNGELRQSANTKEMIVPVTELLEVASQVVTLRPGDVYATGTPDGVGPIAPGDELRIRIDGVGDMTIPVRRREW